MPRYDYRCEAGHTHEARASRDTGSLICPECGQTAQRLIGAAGMSGFARTPTREARLNVSRFIEAQHELVHTAAKHGEEPPDLWAAAKRRVARGDAIAIE